MGRWLERYLAGDRVRVWAEIGSSGDGVRREPDWADAVSVARETMRRARSNVDQLIRLLPEAGYEFEMPQEAHLPPRGTESDALDQLERKIGRLPLSLHCWYEVVGQVNLVGSNPDWQYELTDPLVVNAPLEFVDSEYDAWLEDRGTEWDQGPFRVDIAPDYLHKANISGGAPYAVAVPNQGADGLVLWEPHQTTFVNYLRVAFRWAGLPGWDPAIGHGWSAPPVAFPGVLTEIAESLVPL